MTSQVKMMQLNDNLLRQPYQTHLGKWVTFYIDEFDAQMHISISISLSIYIYIYEQHRIDK